MSPRKAIPTARILSSPEFVREFILFGLFLANARNHATPAAMNSSDPYSSTDGFVRITHHLVELLDGIVTIECQQTLNPSDPSCCVLAIPHLGYSTRIRPDLCGQGATVEAAIERCRQKLVGIPISEIQEAA